MISPDREQLIAALNESRLKISSNELIKQLDEKYANPKHGNFNQWQKILDSLPKITPSEIDLEQDAPVIGNKLDCANENRAVLEENLKKLNPWRKGPFKLFGIQIDSEWRSDLKWSRIVSHLELKDKIVLDIGSSNGYYALRMQALGAKLILGVDPSWRFVFQYLCLQKYLIKEQRAFILPFALEDLHKSLKGLDVIFSMGVLYHRKQPKIHLKYIFDILNEQGQLILETLIIENQDTELLIPNDRYANMPNVWIIPSFALLESWLTETGFKNIKLIDKTQTTIEEQRQTEWSTGYSLADALDSEDQNQTIEGYPAPLRAVIFANR